MLQLKIHNSQYAVTLQQAYWMQDVADTVAAPEKRIIESEIRVVYTHKFFALYYWLGSFYFCNN